jgi:ribosome-binding ATPase YchF (GTP1/OBG family)
MLSVGIVGLPNSGKSTLFNALLKRQQALVGNYPFTTIEPNVGIVEVPDDDLIALVDLINPERVIPATVKFIDIAGLVKDAHQGAGLGNKFLAKIREVDAIVHIIRGFEASDVPHFYGNIDPKRDKEIVDLELELAGIKKPTLYVLNVDQVSGFKLQDSGWLLINAKTGEGVDQLIKAAYDLLGLITFYTIKGGKEVTAWPLKSGATALEAAAKVHTDMAKGFIKAEVVGVKELLKIGGWTKAKALGKIALVGKDYKVKDKEVVEFKFNL